MTKQTIKKRTVSSSKKPKNQLTMSRHVKHAFHATPKFVHGMIAGAFLGVLIVSAAHFTAPVSALGSSTPDCDANSVIWCGVTSSSELITIYHNDGGDGHNTSANIQHIYAYFNIDSADINAMTSDAVSGYVTKSGDVYAGTKLVADNAITAGRENISGSNKIDSGANTFYVRPPSVSFEDNSLEALVVMKDNVFQFAILNSCGNPVKATALTKPPVTITPLKPTPTPTSKPTPSPTPKPTPTPTPTPKPTASPTPTPKPSPTPTPITTTPTSVTALPNTGPGAVIVIGVLAVAGGYVFHMTHRHIKHKRRAATHHRPTNTHDHSHA
jgi:cell division septation protein DedD